MGTHRSRHNKGRKPLYKETGRDTARRHFFFDEKEVVATEFVGLRCSYCRRTLENTQSTSRVAATRDHYLPQSAGGSEVVPCCVQCNKIKGAMLPAEWERFMVENPVWWRKPDLADPRKPSKKAAELLPVVAAYLEKRKAEQVRHDVLLVFPEHRKDQQYRTIREADLDPTTGNEVVCFSERDVLLQLFSERRIGIGQLNAGRRWQMSIERATIQPNMSIDWSRRVSRMPYQCRGDLTHSQSAAMRYRRDFRDYAGPAAVAFLDFCFEADRGRDELIELLGLDASKLGAALNFLLDKLCRWHDDRKHAA